MLIVLRQAEVGEGCTGGYEKCAVYTFRNGVHLGMMRNCYTLLAQRLVEIGLVVIGQVIIGILGFPCAQEATVAM